MIPAATDSGWSRGTVILVINSSVGGGAEKQLLLAARGLARAGFHCIICTLQNRPSHPRLAALIAEVGRLGVVIHEPRSGRTGSMRQLFRLYALVRAQTGAIVWTWGYRADLAGSLLRLLGICFRQVGSLRDADEVSIRRRRWFWRWFFPTLTACISNSRRNVEQLEAVVPGATARCHVIYNGLESELQEPVVPRVTHLPARLRVLMLGNVRIHKKGYDLAVELAALIKATGFPAEIIIGGRPDEGPALAALIAARGVGEVIKPAGLIGDVRGYLQTGDVFLMLSRFEGTPNSLLEAMAQDLPAICTKVGDLTYFARDREHLRLVDIGVVEPVLAALQELRADWAATLAMGRAGGKLCRDLFTTQRLERETVRVFEALAAPEATDADRVP